MQSPEIKELAVALNKAQSQLKEAVKDRENPYFHSKYATLGSVWEACKEALTKNGFSVIQTTGFEGTFFGLYTTLLHSSGQWFRGFYRLNPVKDDPQQLGSALTYARRYGLAAIVGIVTEEDDDANIATFPGRPAAPSEKPELTREPVSQDEETEEGGEDTFTPQAVRPYKAGKGTGYWIVKDRNTSYGTLDQDFAKMAEEAMKSQSDLVVKFVKNGKYLNVVDVFRTVQV